MTVSISAIERAVCAHMKVTPEDLRGPSRARRVARPRQVAMYLSRELTTWSLPEIARHFGDRDHTTILHGQRRIAELIGEKPRFADTVETIRASIKPDDWRERCRMELEACRAIASGLAGGGT